MPASIQNLKTQQSESTNQYCHFRIDSWLSFVADSIEARLILITRKKIYNTYENYLQHCGSLETHNKRTYHCNSLMQNTKLLEGLEKILIQEDIANGFLQPEKIGLRPKALPNQFIMNHSAYTLLTKTCFKITNYCRILSAKNQFHKQFFMIYNAELNISNTGNKNSTSYNNEWYGALAAIMPPPIVEKKLTYVISYSLNPDYLHRVSIAEWDKGILKLHVCFKCDISLFPILKQICSASSLFLAVSSRRVAIQLDNDTGEFLLNLFAAYNNWIHT